MSSSLSRKLERISLLEQKVAIQKNLLLEKALTGTDVNAILKAQNQLRSIESREDVSAERKAYLMDPTDLVNALGFKDRRISMSYEMLKRMSTTPVINAIIKTLTNQVAAFAEPQKDKYSTGFKIVKKPKVRGQEAKMNKQEQQTASDITDFMMSCGRHNSWEHDDFDGFIRKIVKDSLVYDQMSFEVIRDKRGYLYEYCHVDAATVRLSESFDDYYYEEEGKYNTSQRKQKIKGYYPSYVQLLDGVVNKEFYPWDLCFGIRNPDGSVHNYGYGVSELEELIHTVTAILWSEDYNRRFFSQGSAPKGLLKVSKDVSPASLQAFKQQWMSMVTGVTNSWKTPILEADKFDFINLQTNNRDMEFTQWLEYLIKIACAIYCIDPSEINFDISKGGDNKAMFESNNEARLKHSRNKGLYPLLKFVQAKLNKYIVSQLNPDYELQFVGMNADSKTEEADLITKKVSSYMTLNEAREELGYKKIEGGDIVLNGIYAASLQQAQNSTMQQGEENSDNEEGDFNPFEEDNFVEDQKDEEQSK